MKPHRIAIHTDGRLVQGNERQIDVITRGLMRRGHSIHIVARPDTPAWELFAASGAEMSAARPRGTADIVSALRFRSWLRSIRPDAVLFTSWRRLWIAGLVARSAGVPRTVMRFGGRHDIPHGWKGAHYRQALRSFVDRVYANSSLVRDHLIENVPGLDAARVHLIVNAAPQGDVAPAAIRDELRIRDDAPLICAVGGLVRLKGFDVLIRALAASASHAHLILCGEGPERGALQDLSAGLGIADRVHLVGQRSDVRAILAASDLFVLSSRTEGFSVALLEAMAAGLPVISSDVGGASDALCDDSGAERAGWIVPHGDVEALAGAITAVLTSLHEPAVRERAAEARRRAREEFTVERMLDGVERVLLD